MTFEHFTYAAYLTALYRRDWAPYGTFWERIMWALDPARGKRAMLWAVRPQGWTRGVR